MANPWLARRVLNYAHQGGALEAPSSTLFALRRAISVGATAIELDVHLTRDGQVIVGHDGTVDRLTDGSGAIADFTLDELRTLDAGYRFASPDDPGSFPYRGRGPGDPDFRVPTAREVLELFPKTFLNFDIKSGPRAELCAAELAKLLRDFKRRDDVIVASFDDALTDAFAREAPEIGISVGTGLAMELWQAVNEDRPLPALHHVALQLPAEFQGVPVIDAKLVARAHGAGVAVHVWTVNDAAKMKELVGLGVDGIITDRPSVCSRVLTGLGAAYSPG